MTLNLARHGQLDLTSTLVSIRAGIDDPTMYVAAGDVWRSSWTPAGSVTLHLRELDDEVIVEAWGDGADWALEHAPGLVGLHDRLDGFDASFHPALQQICEELAGFRLPRTYNIIEALLWAVAMQGPSVFEAQRAYRQLVMALGRPAPGPRELRTPPEPAALAGATSYDLHTYGFERERADILLRIGAQSHRLEELQSLDVQQVRQNLSTIDGLSEGSIESAMLIAMGDADATPTGDQRRSREVGRVLAGEPHADDSRMLELLEPWRGHRGRVIRLIEAGASQKRHWETQDENLRTCADR